MGEANDETIRNQCSGLRTSIKGTGEVVLHLKEAILTGTLSERCDRGEMVANVMLAYRHLEDAAMRLGKVIQASEEGVSIYDQNDARRVTFGSVGGLRQPE